jgi:hypothetical protein
MITTTTTTTKTTTGDIRRHSGEKVGELQSQAGMPEL